MIVPADNIANKHNAIANSSLNYEIWVAICAMKHFARIWLKLTKCAALAS